MEALRRGIVLRIERDDPSELAAFLSLAARHQWASTGHARSNPACERERHFLPVLEAVAAGDTFVVAKFAQSLMDAPPTKPSVKEYVPLLGAVVALALNDERELMTAVSNMDRCKPKAYVAGMFDVLRGAATGSSGQVAEGLTKMLKAWPKFVFDDPILRLICPHAHGLYRLCQRFSSELVAEFDVSRGKPWDAGFHAWWETAAQSWLDADFSAIDPETHRVLVGLQSPLWWSADEAAAW